jgi:hypothetical protein
MLWINSNIFGGKQIFLLSRPHGFYISSQQTIGVGKDSYMVVIFGV